MLRRIYCHINNARRRAWSCLKFAACSPIVQLSWMPLWTIRGCLHWHLDEGKGRFPLTINMGRQDVDAWKPVPVNTARSLQSFACFQPQNTDYRTNKTTLKVLVKCNYYANITSIMTCVMTCDMHRPSTRVMETGLKYYIGAVGWS